MINLDYKDGKTLHEQIEAGLKELIINKILKEDDQLPSVRELSVELTVNPNTVQRAYKSLEQDGFIYSIKGKGSFVSKISDTITSKRAKELLSILYDTAKELSFLGEDKESLDEIILKAYLSKEDSL